MAASIYFVDDPAALQLDLTGSVLCLHHPDYAPVPIAGFEGEGRELLGKLFSVLFFVFG